MDTPGQNKVVEVIGRLDLEVAVQMGRDVEGLIEHPGWKHVEAFLQRYRDDGIRLLLLPGEPLSRSQYAALTSFVRGVEQALDVPKGIVEGARRAEADLSQPPQETP